MTFQKKKKKMNCSTSESTVTTNRKFGFSLEFTEYDKGCAHLFLFMQI